jgi:hypothetical protein
LRLSMGKLLGSGHYIVIGTSEVIITALNKPNHIL